MHTYIISPISPAQGDRAPACCLCLPHPSHSPGLLHYCVSVDAGDESAAVNVSHFQQIFLCMLDIIYMFINIILVYSN